MNNIKTILKTSNDKISINNFIDMYNCLKEINNKEKHKKFKEDLKDLIQLIIDYLIYGDTKKEQIYFDNFCELDFMGEFIKASKSQNTEILLQIIKSMSALILTLTNQASLYYIFSNNFINKIITNDYIYIQESNEDFLSFYVNFLKSLSMKIDSTTIQLFFQKEKGSFPLLENAIKFYNSEDSMVKNVIRNIFLKFAKLSQEYKPLKEYFTSLPMLKYFCFISCRLTDMTLQLNYFAGYNNLYKNKFGNNNKEFIYIYDNFKSLHDDLIDEILYFQDILSINDEKMVTAAINALLYYYICPLLLGSIHNYKYFFKDNHFTLKYIISPEIALYIFTLIISNIHNDSLLNIICNLLFKKEINSDIITKFVNIQFLGKYPIYPSNYSYIYKDQNYKEKNLSFVQYITYNFNQKFICSLLFKKNSKYKEIIQLQKKYEKSFDDPDFDPYEKYDSIYNDIISKLSKKEKDFMREYHNIISTATGIKCGLSENEFQNNVLDALKEENNMVINPIRLIILEKYFKFNDELINMEINLLLYSIFYKALNEENNDINMNKSLSRKLLYYECNLLPYDLYINKKILNKTVDSVNNSNNTENNFKLFKTENYELKYIMDDIYSKEYIYDNNIFNNLINLLQSSNPFCSLEILLIIYNIKYLLFPLNLNENNSDNVKLFEFNQEQKYKLINTLYIYIQKINSLLSNNISIKLSAFELLENIWNLYKTEYSFNSKNSIIKYILTSNYIAIPSFTSNVEDYPFKTNNNKYTFNTYLMGYISLYDLIYFNSKNEFPIENGNFEYKIGDKVNIENINIHNSKFKIIKVLLKKNYKNEFDECIIFMNKNCFIFGNEEKSTNDGINTIKVNYIYPLRELEICFDNSYPNSLQLYFKKNNHIIQCESNEERKEIKAELEQKRNEFRKWEQDNIIKFFTEQENKYKELVNINLLSLPQSQPNEENKEQEKIELFGWQ